MNCTLILTPIEKNYDLSVYFANFSWKEIPMSLKKELISWSETNNFLSTKSEIFVDRIDSIVY